MSVLLFKPKANPKKYGPAATFTRASVAYDSSLKQVASGLPRIGIDGVMVEEATTNLLPAGAENFVTEWGAYGGEGITVTDYPTNIPGIGDVIAKRITGNGAGTSAAKYMSALISGLTSGRTTAITAYALSLNSATVTKIGDQYGNSGSYTTVPTITIQRLASVQSYASVNSQFRISVALATDILDIVVYAPQIEAKPYATSYTPPETTRAAEFLTIPVNAVDLGGGVIDYSNAVLNPSVGTIECDVNFDNIQAGHVINMIVGAGTTGSLANSLHLFTSKASNAISLQIRNAASVSKSIETPPLTLAGIKRVGATYNNGAMTLWFNGTKYTTTTGTGDGILSSLQTIMVGSRPYDSPYRLLNSQISNLRISKIARTDTEMAYTGTLRKDSHTTFLRQFKGAF